MTAKPVGDQMIASKDIKLVPTASIKINPKNRNKHGADQIERLVKIIQYQGFRNPLIVSKRTEMLVAGHGRLLAAKRMKLKSVPVMFQDFENEAQEYACMVSDNAIASWSLLDISAITADLSGLGPDFNIDLLGISNFTADFDNKEFDPDHDDSSDDTSKECPHCGGKI